MPAILPTRTVPAVLAAVLAAGALTGCSGGPVKAGSAALVGDDRITVRALDAAVTDWRREFKEDGAANALRADPESGGAGQAAALQASGDDLSGALSGMIAIRVADEVARRVHLDVTATDVDRIVAQMDAQQGARAYTLAKGLPTSYTRDLARFYTVQTAVLGGLARGAQPGSAGFQRAAQTTEALFARTAAGMKIEVNPRYGRYDPAQLKIDSVPSMLSATESGVR
ncbi:hypothetical protein [Actinomadura parmotrematis]|uniref:Lipoprotein n=1 Tax=Actinomadura parmotrematis TaxID=2864039 RepID=A0ABS7FMJ7_9ACTN|nr:hypothetical protein [Actinomadura parmotrematis]MBW8481596.1 hypothetical protein [Actinomadura parmotrematis]